MKSKGGIHVHNVNVQQVGVRRLNGEVRAVSLSAMSHEVQKVSLGGSEITAPVRASADRRQKLGRSLEDKQAVLFVHNHYLAPELASQILRLPSSALWLDSLAFLAVLLASCRPVRRSESSLENESLASSASFPDLKTLILISEEGEDKVTIERKFRNAL
ncbi:hypothetical protein WAI453_003817 [Rhynchosporium graminicola]